MLFGLSLINKTWDESIDEIGSWACDEKTLIFLDTNILFYLYKLHTDARGEFFNWTDSVLREDRLRIPAWAASEYLKRVKAGEFDSFTPANKKTDQPKKQLEDMLATVGLFLDSTVLRAIGFVSNRSEFLDGFRKVIGTLPTYTKAFKHQFDPEAVHDEIQTHLSSAILKADLVDLCVRAEREGNARVKHQLPPGFCDANKEENRFGDLIIWFEILQNSKEFKKKFSKVLFITNDEKKDWVYVPKRRMQATPKGRISIPNSSPELKLIDPLLVNEFKTVVGDSDIVICSLLFLIEGLSKSDPKKFTQLSAAIQINNKIVLEEDSIELRSDTGRADLPPAAESDIAQSKHNLENDHEKTTITTLQLSYDHSALADEEYDSGDPTEINKIIRALKSYNWYIQNPAINLIETILEEKFSPTSLFVLGRNIYQAACGNSIRAMIFVENLNGQLSRFSLETSQHLLAGMLFEIYFDSHGEFRQKPKSYFIEMPLLQIEEEEFSNVRSFIRHQLEPHSSKLRFMPGDQNQVPLDLRSSPLAAVASDSDPQRELLSAKIYGVELIQNPKDANDKYYGTKDYTTESLLQEISRTLGIPHRAITPKFDPEVNSDVVFIISEGRQLRIEAALPEANSNTESVDHR